MHMSNHGLNMYAAYGLGRVVFFCFQHTVSDTFEQTHEQTKHIHLCCMRLTLRYSAAMRGDSSSDSNSTHAHRSLQPAYTHDVYDNAKCGVLLACQTRLTICVVMLLVMAVTQVDPTVYDLPDHADIRERRWTREQRHQVHPAHDVCDVRVPHNR